MKSDITLRSVGKDKIRRKAPIKVVLRRLPCGFTWEQLKTQLEPLPEVEFLQFIPADPEEEEFKFARVYLVFKNDEDIVSFRDRYNGYVFVDPQGVESIGLVELAPNPKVPRHRRDESRKRDKRCSTIETDPEFKQFLDEREHPAKTEVPSVEDRIKEIEEKERSFLESSVQETPLTQFLIRKTDEKFRRLQDKRRVREDERKVRLQRLFEKEQRERAERKEAKKITEFRNSKIDPSLFRDNVYKENRKERDYDSKRKEDVKERTKTKEELEKTYKAVERRYKNDYTLKKERVKSNREKDGLSEGTEIPERLEKVKNDSSENGMKPVAEKMKETKEEVLEKPPIVRKAVSTRSGSTAKENTVSSTSAEGSKKPRRNKDRPERAIYQPSAVRRRMAALHSSKEEDHENESAELEEGK